MDKRRRNEKGFTLIELIVVMIIIGILVLLAAPRFLRYVEKAKYTRIINDTKVVESISIPYHARRNEWPIESEVPVTMEGKAGENGQDQDGLVISIENEEAYRKEGILHFDGEEVSEDKFGTRFSVGKKEDFKKEKWYLVDREFVKEETRTRLKGIFLINNEGVVIYLERSDSIDINNNGKVNLVLRIKNINTKEEELKKNDLVYGDIDEETVEEIEKYEGLEYDHNGEKIEYGDIVIINKEFLKANGIDSSEFRSYENNNGYDRSTRNWHKVTLEGKNDIVLEYLKEPEKEYLTNYSIRHVEVDDNNEIIRDLIDPAIGQGHIREARWVLSKKGQPKFPDDNDDRHLYRTMRGVRINIEPMDFEGFTLKNDDENWNKDKTEKWIRLAKREGEEGIDIPEAPGIHMYYKKGHNGLYTEDNNKEIEDTWIKNEDFRGRQKGKILSNEIIFRYSNNKDQLISVKNKKFNYAEYKQELKYHSSGRLIKNLYKFPRTIPNIKVAYDYVPQIIKGEDAKDNDIENSIYVGIVNGEDGNVGQLYDEKKIDNDNNIFTTEYMGRNTYTPRLEYQVCFKNEYNEYQDIGENGYRHPTASGQQGVRFNIGIGDKEKVINGKKYIFKGKDFYSKPVYSTKYNFMRLVLEEK